MTWLLKCDTQPLVFQLRIENTRLRCTLNVSWVCSFHYFYSSLLYLLSLPYHSGSEAVDWLVKTQSINRDTALRTMQQIFTLRVIYHIGEENEFIDGAYFYTFMVCKRERR
jgi:Domain found in Dishevelled, Egl-10, and Pleckstrin (DEP)